MFKNLKKRVKLERDEECKKEFDKIKSYLSNPPVPAPPQPNIPLILYLITTATAVKAMLASKIEGEERVIYYISKK